MVGRSGIPIAKPHQAESQQNEYNGSKRSRVEQPAYGTDGTHSSNPTSFASGSDFSTGDSFSEQLTHRASLSVADFLDRYCTNCVEAEGLRDPVTIKGRLKAVAAGDERMAYPKIDRATEIRIVNSRDGVMVYGNTAAFRTLARWMTWLANSDPSEHCEMHIPWHLQSPMANQERVFMFSKSSSGRVTRDRSTELTFMVLNRTELRNLGIATATLSERNRTPKARTVVSRRKGRVAR
jgi:hypothetical protein